MKKKLICVILSFILSLSFIMPANASSSSEYLDELLIDAGLPEMAMDMLNIEEKEMYYEMYLENGQQFEVPVSYLETDNLETLNMISTMTFDDLVETGADPQAIEESFKIVERIKNSSIKDLIKFFGISNFEAELIKKATELQKSRTKKADVTSAGTISSSKLGVSILPLVSLSSSNPKYQGIVIFSWTTPPLTALYNDSLYLAWNGNMVFSPINSSTSRTYVEYRSVNTLVSSYGSQSKTITPEYVEISANSSGQYYFGAAYPRSSSTNDWANRVYGGRMTFQIYQTSTKKGTTGTIIANYLHRTLSSSVNASINGVTISYSGSKADISISQGKQTFVY